MKTVWAVDYVTKNGTSKVKRFRSEIAAKSWAMRQQDKGVKINGVTEAPKSRGRNFLI